MERNEILSQVRSYLDEQGFVIHDLELLRHPVWEISFWQGWSTLRGRVSKPKTSIRCFSVNIKEGFSFDEMFGDDLERCLRPKLPQP